MVKSSNSLEPDELIGPPEILLRHLLIQCIAMLIHPCPNFNFKIIK